MYYPSNAIRIEDFTGGFKLFFLDKEQFEYHYTPNISTTQQQEERRQIIARVVQTLCSKPIIEKAKKRFEHGLKEGYLDSKNRKWHHGFDSVIKLDGAVRLAELSNKQYVVFFDMDNKTHQLTIQEAKQIVIELGKDYQHRLSILKDIIKRLSEAKTVDEVNSIDISVIPSNYFDLLEGGL